MVLMGIDPGLASTGIAVVRFDGVPWIQDIHVLHTEKSDKKRNLRQADDLAERCRVIHAHLDQVILNYKPQLLCVEASAMPFGRSRFSVVAALGRVRGLIDALADQHRLCIIEETPQAVRKMLCGKAKVSEEEITQSLERTFPQAKSFWPTRKSDHEHAIDALSTVVAGLQSPLFRAMVAARSLPRSG